MAAVALSVVDEPPPIERREQRISRLREEALFLVDEIFDLEAQLPYPPERVCPGCRQSVAARAY